MTDYNKLSLRHTIFLLMSLSFMRYICATQSLYWRMDKHDLVNSYFVSYDLAFILYLYSSKNKTERCDIFSIVADSASWGWKLRGEKNSNKSTML